MKNTFFTRLRYLFNKALFQEMFDKSTETEATEIELAKTETLLNEAESRIKSLEDELYQMNDKFENEKYKVWYSEMKFKLMLNPNFADALKNKEYNKAYDIAKVYIDEEGYSLYSEAEKYTNINVFSYFYTEDNMGCFENANGFELLRYLEVAAFGEVDWMRISDSCYEKAVNMSLNTETPEYQRYRNEVCAKVLEKKLGITLMEPVVAESA